MAPDDYDQPRQVRVPDDEWFPFEQATRAIHPTGRSPRGPVLREFIRWYMHRPGAKLPKRPGPGPWSTIEPAPDPAAEALQTAAE